MDSRVSLRLATTDDVGFIADIKSNPAYWPFECDIETDKEKVAKRVIERAGGDWYRQYVIQLNNGDTPPIGECHIHQYVEERRSWEIGYCVLPEYQRRGYCHEAVSIILQYAFDDFGAHRVVAMCNARNTASIRILEKSGMVKEGVFRQELPWNGQWVDQLFYAILDCEYRSHIS